MYGLKPVPFKLKPVPFKLKPVPFVQSDSCSACAGVETRAYQPYPSKPINNHRCSSLPPEQNG